MVFGFTSLMACSDSGSQCPSLNDDFGCVPHALADMDVTGTWTFTGTQTDNHCMSSPSTTTAVSFRMTLGIVGCTFEITGQADDTIAIYSSGNLEGSTSEQVCVAANTGQLTYSRSQTQRCIPTNPTPETIVISGTLQR